MTGQVITLRAPAVRLLAALLLRLALAAALPSPVSAQTPGPAANEVLYAAVGDEIVLYALDPNHATLSRRGQAALPANVQEAWFSPSHQYLYVAWSNGGASYASSPAPKNDHHGITAFRIDPRSGALLPHGPSASLPSRPIFTTTSVDGAYIVTAHNDPSSLTVHRILPDGTLGGRIPQPPGLDFGIYGHQVRADPSGQTIILVTRGNGPTAARPEDPGALRIFGFRNGTLTPRQTVAPGGGFGYQVRHLDFHPSGKWVFVTLERQNQLHVYGRSADGALTARPLFVRSTLMPSTKPGPGQTAASIHVHPNGRFVYVANRSADTVDFDGTPVFAGGENSIAVFSIDPRTGEPALIQSIGTQGFTPRTFALDPSGSLLAVANQSPLAVRGASGVRSVPASLALFRIRADGRLEFARKYDIETTPDRNLFWTGIAALP